MASDLTSSLRPAIVAPRVARARGLAPASVRAGRVVTHRAILAAGWPEEPHAPIEYLRLVIRNLRLKIEAEPSRPAIVVNEPGIGYRLVEAP